MRPAHLVFVVITGCLAHAEDPAPAAPPAPVTQECTTFPIRQTASLTAFQAPADLANAKLNTTKLPPGFTAIGGTVGEGGAFVVACRSVP